jgi:branched-chain amino acid transport system substrate-binding protein
MVARHKSLIKCGSVSFTLFVLVSIYLIGNAAVPALAAELPPIKVGAIVPYTWEDPTTNQIDKGLKMKLDEVGWKVAGRKIEFIGEDDAGNAVKSVEKANKLIEGNKVCAIFGPVNANCAMAAANYTKGSKTAQFTIVELPYAGMKLGGQNVFSIHGTQQGITKDIGGYAYDLAGYRTAAVIHQDFVAGEELANGFIDAFQSKGGKIIQRQRVPVGTMDFAPYVTAIQKADVVACWLLPQETLRLLPVYLNSGLNIPFIQLHGSFPEEMLQQVGDKTLGILSVIRWCKLDENPVNKRFLDAFTKKYGEAPNYMGVTAYEQMSFLLEGLKATNGDTTPEVLNNAVRKVKLSLPSGTTSFNNEGIAIGDRNIVRVEKVGGKLVWKPIKKLDQVLYKSPGEK